MATRRSVKSKQDVSIVGDSVAAKKSEELGIVTKLVFSSEEVGKSHLVAEEARPVVAKLLSFMYSSMISAPLMSYYAYNNFIFLGKDA